MDFTPFQTHLEYLGYKTRLGGEGKVKMMFAEAAGKPDFNISRLDGSDFSIIRSNWIIMNFADDINEAVNKLNSQTVNISSVWHYQSADESKALGISSAYFGDYDKKLFGIFMDVYLADVARVITSEIAAKYLNETKDT